MINIKIFKYFGDKGENEINEFLLENGKFLIDRPAFFENIVVFTFDTEIKEVPKEEPKEKTREQTEAEGIMDGMLQEIIKLKIQRETLHAQVTVQNMENISAGREINHVENEQRKSIINNIDQRIRVLKEMEVRYQKIAEGKENEEDNSGKSK